MSLIVILNVVLAVFIVAATLSLLGWRIIADRVANARLPAPRGLVLRRARAHA